MFEKAKKYLDKRDWKHLIADTMGFLLALIPVILMYPDEVEGLLRHIGVIPPLATIITAVGIVALRRILSLPVIETRTTTTTATATLEVTEPMPETLSPSNDTNATDTPTVSQ